MNGEKRYTIGDLARRTGVRVKTIRFWSDRGIVPPTDRGPSGHRQLAPDAVARVELVRTLRDLGVDLATVRRVLAGEVPFRGRRRARGRAGRPDPGAAVAARGADRGRPARVRPAEADCCTGWPGWPRGNAGTGRRFLDEAFTDLADAESAGVIAVADPGVPDDAERPSRSRRGWSWPSWPWSRVPGRPAPAGRAARRRPDGVEVRPPGRGRRGPGGGGPGACRRRRPEGPRPTRGPGRAPARTRACTAGRTAPACGGRLLDRLALASDSRRDRYLDLLSVINGWATGGGVTPAVDWFSRALRAACRKRHDLSRTR